MAAAKKKEPQAGDVKIRIEWVGGRKPFRARALIYRKHELGPEDSRAWFFMDRWDSGSGYIERSDLFDHCARTPQDAWLVVAGEVDRRRRRLEVPKMDFGTTYEFEVGA